MELPAAHQTVSTYQPYNKLTTVHQPPIIPDVQFENTNVQHTMESGILNNYIGFETLDIKLTSIMQEQISTNLMINRIFVKIQLMEANLKNKGQNNDTYIQGWSSWKKLGLISTRHFRRIVQTAKKKCAMTFELLPQNTAIPSTVISSNMSQVETSSIVYNLFSSCSSGSDSDSAFNVHQEEVNNYNFSDVQNCNISDTLLTPNFKETLNNSSINICDKLRYCILQYKVSHNGVDSLLSILRSEGIKVPKDVRTLMNTPKTK